ncbi:MAG TPA: thioredoxin-disulfide reductase [bacterium]|jgi:thioredoxin reductase (NADPH)|nr:thioredoxin-disulfide reductase [bacterium]HNT64317.1 thioredoxin-disulfide reductase [bacterium]HOX85307.1 thioredoxin-disulfide reductase [bacterium]HPG44466.1 thioredoxin-disulfide reductase [bacterium]HPM97024.1 thioredoxin-disulfide reductase [bacterium]
MRNVIIIGSGPAGMTAAIYTARANLKPLVISGLERGGQVTLTNDLENYPGFPDGLGGFEMYQLLEKQAQKFGAEIIYDTVTRVDLSGEVKKVFAAGQEFDALSVIIATGSTPKRLGVLGEQEMIGRGVSYCATCDGFFFTGKPVAVIGGGNSALDEGLFLTRFASKVTIIHRRDRLRADAILQQRAMDNEKIEFIWDTVVEEIAGKQGVEKLILKNAKTGEKSELAVDGVFVFIGHRPNVELFETQVALADDRTIQTDRRTRTNLPGVFACGDVQDSIYRQAITAAGSGCQSAIEAEKYITHLQGKAYPGK